MDNLIIDVRNARAYVSRKVGTDASFRYESCANWTWLEDAAAEAVEAQGGSITLSALYPCPTELARFALWPEDILEMVTTPPEARTEFGIDEDTARKSAREGRIPARQSASTWLIYRPAARERWGKDSSG